jgi:hypothetical protein
VATHIPVADSTACTDTDNISCTTAGCESGQCIQTHVNTCQEAICRTPGFWGTHAGTEKDKENNPSQNITQAVIDACGGCLDVCGGIITNTALNNSDSAVEAICVSVAGDIRLQLARQLTAMDLNCCISGFGNGCGGDADLASLYGECNNLCAGIPDNALTVQSCIDQIDCFNNGGHFNGSCVIDDSDNCHERLLVNESLGLNFEPPGPAGSSEECNFANGSKKNPNFCAVIPKPTPAASCSVKNQGDTCCTSGTIGGSCSTD